MTNREKLNNIAVSAILTTLSSAGHTLNDNARGEEKKSNEQVLRKFAIAAQEFLSTHPHNLN